MYEAYFPVTAQVKYEENRKASGAKLKLDETIEFIKFKEAKILNDEWSPDAVCGFAERNNLFDNARVCTKTLYNYIEHRLITVKYIDLPMKVRLNTKTKRSRVNKRVIGRSIEERPAEAENREVFGHWEINTVIRKKSQDEALLTITERKTRKEIILRILAKSSEAVSAAICEIRKNYGPNFANVFKTITADNGSEFSELDTSVLSEDTEIFFEHPYTSWERGTNERHNELIRRFIPKGKQLLQFLKTQFAMQRTGVITYSGRSLGIEHLKSASHKISPT